MSSWTWRYEAADGSVMAGDHLPDRIFPSQADAESWVGESWRGLTAAGVDKVSLLRDGEIAYGPMSLHPLQ